METFDLVVNKVAQFMNQNRTHKDGWDMQSRHPMHALIHASSEVAEVMWEEEEDPAGKAKIEEELADTLICLTHYVLMKNYKFDDIMNRALTKLDEAFPRKKREPDEDEEEEEAE